MTLAYRPILEILANREAGRPDADIRRLQAVMSESDRELRRAAEEPELLRDLIDEGWSFRQTLAGQRWQTLLVHSGIASRAWRLWQVLELDDAVNLSARSTFVEIQLLSGLLSPVVAATALSEAAMAIAFDQDPRGEDDLTSEPLFEDGFSNRNVVLDLFLGLICSTERSLVRFAKLPPVNLPLQAVETGAFSPHAYDPILR